MHIRDGLGKVRLAVLGTAQQAMHRRVSQYGSDIRCGSGCNGCCYRMIYVTIAEAVLVYDYLQKLGVWPETRRKAMQLIQFSSLAPEAYFKMNLSCPVLKSDGTCSAYEVRPTPCSTHFAISDPGLCSPLSTAPGQFKPIEMNDLYNKFLTELDSNLEGHGILAFRMPMASALLLAEKISAMEITSSEDMISLIRSEFR